MNKREDQVFTAYTGMLFGEFDWFHQYAQDLLGRPVWTHELSSPAIWTDLKRLSEPEFLEINNKSISEETTHEEIN